MNKKAVILLSGGIDSSTCLYLAKKQGYEVYPLVFDYGQRHKKELESAFKIAESAGVNPAILKISLPWKGSSLLDKKIKLPETGCQRPVKIPSTYVPARNIIFLSFALSYAESIGADAIFIGAHMQDYSGYPDCRDNFFKAFRNMAKLGTKAGVENKGIKILTPLIHKSKKDIIKLGLKLAVPYELTWSCYSGDGLPCGKCESCIFRQNAFESLGLVDPLLLQSKKKYVSKSFPTAKISDIFESVQGEGIYAGIAQTFIRFFGCNIGCEFCDTKNLSFREYSKENLLENLANFKHNSISLTGGEPLLQKDFLKNALPILKKNNKSLYLETNGILALALKEIIDYIDIVAMDFKLPSSTGKKSFWQEHQKFLKIASGKDVFVKIVICALTNISDINMALKILRKNNKNIPLILQPNFSEPQALEKTLSFQRHCLNHWDDVRVMPQMHKYMGVK